MVACLFAADVITQNIVCRQGPILCCDCAKDEHTLFQHLVTQMCLCFVHKMERNKGKNRETLVVLGPFIHSQEGYNIPQI